ncbi:NADP-dependent phosphogluconate dehydrogenase [Pseudothermotoga thermarum]|uniref:6-phosphogluconate dehydrogenase, decarboxylating n=1 Tax=Pseudothermotoga thermarum DSM 5069 TaxID=688269 RepID=F7YTH7_9THEM|nr:NADP-dependent phosphogluconate dehydrogenase [Pseudothermotoga thermarum]AEH51191.1 6-phosphogluconate dehydrogenase (decarboxylating) [Pseudothermotoga thermarum DSM 5069]
MKAQIGVVGLAVMGQNLALNIARKGYIVAVYNRTSERTKNFVEQRVKGEKIVAAYDLKSFVESLERPRKIILMVKAGSPVDEMIDELLPYLQEGDLLIDAGNSHYEDTNRRLERLSKMGILFLGTGVSGGEYGALHGPSIMPGGTKEAYKLVEEIFLKIAAKTEDGPCCTYVGDYSAGHFVKMVHNGIEYAIMQAIAEVYDIMRKVLGLQPKEIGEIFKKWNEGELSSFLVEITYKIMEKIDEETGKPMVDVILDKAEQKGTGKWTVEAALDLGVPTPSLNLAVVARVLSHFKQQRMELSKLYWQKPIVKADKNLIEYLEKALSLAMFLAYSQGLWLISEASKAFNYGVNLLEILRIWKGGCIIRAKMIDFLREILKENPSNVNLLESQKTVEYLKPRIEPTLKVCQIAREAQIPTPVLNSSLDYLFSMKEANLPANLIQAQRDFFGAHTFERIDKPGIYHIEWQPLE